MLAERVGKPLAAERAGLQLAMLGMKCLLATLARAVDLERSEVPPPAERYAFLMMPESFSLAARERHRAKAWSGGGAKLR